MAVLWLQELVIAHKFEQKLKSDKNNYMHSLKMNCFIPQVNKENKENEKMCMSFSNFPEEYKKQFVPFFKSKG